MSLAFSDTTNKDGIIQQIEQALGFSDGYISGNTTRLAQFTGDVNLALDNAFSAIFHAGGTWQFDDSNHTANYPIITADIVSGQADYTFTSDGSSNLILDIYKVRVADSTGTFKTLDVADKQSYAKDTFGTTSGRSERYDRTGNGIFLDPKPDYNYTAGIEIYINREGSYFTTSDTTKKPGFNGLYHEYLVLKPAYKYARAHGLPQRKALKQDLFELEANMIEHYGGRGKDIVRRLGVTQHDNR